MSAADRMERMVPIASIRIGKRQRSFDPELAAAIAATIPTLGLKNAIEVVEEPEGFLVVTGRHRLEGVKLTGASEVRVRVLQLDGAHPEAAAALHEAFENLVRGELTALDRMAHLASAKQAHDELYPSAAKRGPKKSTRAADAINPSFGQMPFSREAAQRMGFSHSLVMLLVKAYADLTESTRNRLRGSKLADKQGEIIALSKQNDASQAIILDMLLSSPPQAATVEDALAIILKRDRPDESQKRYERVAKVVEKFTPTEWSKLFDEHADQVEAWLAAREAQA